MSKLLVCRDLVFVETPLTRATTQTEEEEMEVVQKKQATPPPPQLTAGMCPPSIKRIATKWLPKWLGCEPRLIVVSLVSIVLEVTSLPE